MLCVCVCVCVYVVCVGGCAYVLCMKGISCHVPCLCASEILQKPFTSLVTCVTLRHRPSHELRNEGRERLRMRGANIFAIKLYREAYRR